MFRRFKESSPAAKQLRELSINNRLLSRASSGGSDARSRLGLQGLFEYALRGRYTMRKWSGSAVKAAAALIRIFFSCSRSRGKL